MSSDWAGKAAFGAITPTISGLFVLLAGWVGGGFFSIPLLVLGPMLSVGAGIAFNFQRQRYLIFLGTSATIAPRATAAAKADHAYNRAQYLRIRASLAEGGKTARLYKDTLRTILRRVDRFFGDTHPVRRTWVHNLCRLHVARRFWTAPTYDRCLMLALIYPIAVILIVWMFVPHDGPAEQALELRQSVAWYWRASLVVDVAFLTIVACRYGKSSGRAKRYWGLAGAIAGSVLVFVGVHGAVAVNIAGAVNVAGAVAVAVTGAAAVIFSVMLTGAGAVAGAVAVAVTGAIAVNAAGAVNVAGAVSGAVAGAGAGAFVIASQKLNDWTIRRGWQGVFLAFQTAILIFLCFTAPLWLAGLPTWHRTGALLLFLGLLTLINAPADFFSIGLTRLLLRLGLEHGTGNWWPAWLALADATIAAALIFILGLALVFVIQFFDALSVLGGGTPVLPLVPLLDRLQAQPLAAENLWVHAMLLTTALPSTINLAIGAFSLTRGFHWLNHKLLHNMPEDGPVPTANRPFMAFVLTGHIFIGIALGIAAQAGILYGLIGVILPAFGADLLEKARAFAAADPGGTVVRLLLGSGE